MNPLRVGGTKKKGLKRKICDLSKTKIVGNYVDHKTGIPFEENTKE